jgi:hypothetical protein
MRCLEQRRLLRRYSEATAKLSDMAVVLAGSALSYEREAFERAWKKCEDARVLCARIREEMYLHLESHRCALQLGANLAPQE